MRIGLFTDTFLPIVDGVGRVVYAYAETLSGMGHQVTVSAPMYETGFRGGYPFDLIDYSSMKVPTAPQYRSGIALLDPHYRKRITAASLDIVHAHSPFGAGKEALRVAREKQIPIISSFHSKYYDDFYKVTKNETLSRLLIKNIVYYYKSCDQVWVVSEATGDVLKSYGFTGPITVMPNGVTIRNVNAELLHQIDDEYGLNNQPMLLFVGQMNWKKNILRVLEACSLLHKNQIDFKLLLAGQGPDEKEIAAKIVDLGLENHALMIGHVGDTKKLDALYARASVFTFPSLYDNAPMVVREAAVMGTPAVLVGGSSAAEVIHDGKNGFLCNDDSKDLYRVLSNALLNPIQTREVGLVARDTIPIPWEKVMEKVVLQYKDLINSPRKKSRFFLGTVAKSNQERITFTKKTSGEKKRTTHKKP